MDKEVRTDAKLKNLSNAEQLELWELRYPTDPDQPKISYSDILAIHLPDLGVSCSLSTLSSFYKWLRQKRRVESAMERTEQAKQEWLKKNPKASSEELARYGQFVFTNETIEDGNVKGFVALQKLRVTQQKLDIESRRVKILEEKANRLDRLKQDLEDRKDRGGLSTETIEEIERSLKML